MALPTAFYLPRGDHFESTTLTRGPWSVDHQHAGPPSALLVRALEEAAARQGAFHTARVQIDILRPIPIAPVQVVMEGRPMGRRVLHATALLQVQGRTVARARGLFIREADLPVPDVAKPPGPTLPTPDEAVPTPFPFFRWDEGLHVVFELRFTHGGFGQAASGAWMRCTVPLVDGEALAPTHQAMIASDCGNGISNVLPMDRFTFMNPDLHVAFSRAVQPGWIHLAATTEVSDLGSGWARSVLSDADGMCGRGVQTLFVDGLGR